MDPTPRNPPMSARGRPAPIVAARVTTVRTDGRVDVRLEKSRASRIRAIVPVGYTPAVGDRVAVTNLDGNPNTPIILAALGA